MIAVNLAKPQLHVRFSNEVYFPILRWLRPSPQASREPKWIYLTVRRDAPLCASRVRKVGEWRAIA